MKILIADYYALLRDGLSILVKDVADDVTITHCDTFDGVTDAIAQQNFDLVLIDFNLPNFDGFASIRALRESLPELRVVVMAASERWTDACGAIAAGARGYIPKSASSAIMLAALRLIFSGGVYLPPLLGQAALGAHGIGARGNGNGDGTAPELTGERKLTPRQMEVLRCLARGQSNKEIAYHLGLSQGTVKIHIAAIFKAFKVRNRTQAVIAAGIRE